MFQFLSCWGILLSLCSPVWAAPMRSTGELALQAGVASSLSIEEEYVFYRLLDLISDSAGNSKHQFQKIIRKIDHALENSAPSEDHFDEIKLNPAKANALMESSGILHELLILTKKIHSRTVLMRKDVYLMNLTRVAENHQITLEELMIRLDRILDARVENLDLKSILQSKI